MGFDITEIRFPSADGIHTLYGEIYTPATGDVRGVVQIVHGMTDHIGRYRELAASLAERGYAVAGHCHLGHGKSAATREELGFFAKRGGAELLISDVHTMNRLIRGRFPDSPIAVMGHSMGSFIVRLYAARYHDACSAVIIHAGGGAGIKAFAGGALIGMMKVILGGEHRAVLIRSVSSWVNGLPFRGRGANAWLTRDSMRAEERRRDPYADFTFTLSAYGDLLRLVRRSNSGAWFKRYPQTVPTLIVSGSMDPVGGFGKGVRRVYRRLLKNGQRALTLKIYDGAGHELFNETNREEFFAYIADWLGGVI